MTNISIFVNMSRMQQLLELIDQRCCPPMLRAPLGHDEAETMAATLKVIADPARLRLLSLLANSEGYESCVCNLTDPLGLSQPTVSHHLRILSEAGLVHREQRGRWAFYSLTEEAVQRLGHVLTFQREDPAHERTA